ncbi:collectin-12-like [Actinia tenebrosa]|uniref:Collectin-12-like n=1 Tax=Actinia tenebrosa TaxID=6105 RepID=A0A6P8INJ3_ACTTE|nr:collectin-12-like [Actinia tenebrosa]
MEHQTPIRITAIALLLVIFQSESFFAIETDYCSCYSFHKIPKNWEDSNKICQDNNGTVISMETEEEYQFINKTIQSLDVRKNEWFIGLKGTSRTDDWKWISGHDMTIDKWLPGEPRGSEGCVKMIKHYKGWGLFDDIDCRTLNMFICEYNEVQSCSSINNKWCFLPPNLPTTKERTTTPSTTSDKKSTAVIYSSTEKGQQTKAFIQTTKPEGTRVIERLNRYVYHGVSLT